MDYNGRVGRFFFIARTMMHDEAGNFAIMTALVITALLIVIGSALDFGYALVVRNEMQIALDSAVLVGVRENQTKRDAKAISFYTANFSSHSASLQNTAAPTFQTEADRSYSGTASIDVPTTFMKIAGINSVTVSVNAAAIATPGGTPICILSLDPVQQKGLLASGSSNINANNCRVQVNSTSAGAVEFSGGSKLNSAENCFVGGVKQGLSNMVPSPTPSCKPVNDPFQGLSPPSATHCDHTSFDKNTNTILKPGSYCGGMRVSDATFTFEPGLYIIKDGTFESSGGATLKGNGVTFFLTGTSAAAGLVWSGGGSYRFTAMTSGPLAGFVVYLDPDALKASTSHVSGGGDIYYEGAFYFPNQTLLISGGGMVNTPSPFTAYVANSIEYTGGGSLTIGLNPEAATVPIPEGLFAGSELGGTRLLH